MKTKLAGLTAAALLALGANAALADGYESVASAPIMISDNDWSGFFVSGSIGYGWGKPTSDVGG